MAGAIREAMPFGVCACSWCVSPGHGDCQVHPILFEILGNLHRSAYPIERKSQ